MSHLILDVEAECKVCGNSIESEIKISDDYIKIIIVPCQGCLEYAATEARGKS